MWSQILGANVTQAIQDDYVEYEQNSQQGLADSKKYGRVSTHKQLTLINWL